MQMNLTWRKLRKNRNLQKHSREFLLRGWQLHTQKEFIPIRIVILNSYFMHSSNRHLGIGKEMGCQFKIVKDEDNF